MPVPLKHCDLALFSTSLCLPLVPSPADLLEDWMEDVNARVDYAVAYGKQRGFVKSGEPVVVVTGWQKGAGFTNTMRVLYVK